MRRSVPATSDVRPGPESDGWLARRGPLLLCLAALLPQLVPVLDPAVQLYYRDTLRLYYPVKRFIADQLALGRLPLWDPWTESGTSLLGQLSPGLLHPLTLLYVALPFDLAFKLNHLVALPLAAGGAYALARRLPVTRPAAAVAGVGYAGSGYLLSMTASNLPYALGAATLPWAVAGTNPFVDSDGLGAPVLLLALLAALGPRGAGAAADRRPRPRQRAAGLEVRELDPGPRAFLVERVVTPPTGHGVAEVFADGTFEARKVAVVTREESEQLSRAGLQRGSVAASGSATLARPGPDRLAVEVDAQGGHLVVIGEHFDPGWSATLDGEPAPVVAADGLALGVYVPSGRHRLLLRFRLPGLVPGLGLAGAALLALALAGLRERRRLAGSGAAA